MLCNEFLERHTEFRDGLITSSRELRRFSRHLAHCGVCRRYDVTIRQAVLALHSATPISPSADFRERLDARLAVERRRVPRQPAEAGVSATMLVIAAVALFCSLVAVTVAVPTATPVTTPAASTGATLGALLAQLTERPVSGFPSALRGVAASGTACPTATIAAGGFTVTDATAGPVPPGSLPQARRSVALPQLSRRTAAALTRIPSARSSDPWPAISC